MEAINGIPLPPQSIIFMDKDREAGIAAGKHRLQRLRSFGVRVPSGRVLDLGCGWGRMAYALADAGFYGKYVGVDILKRQVEWLRSNFTPHDSRYRFHLIDVANDRYNPKGSATRVDLAPLAGGPVNVALAYSVFTHLFEAQILDYLRQVHGLLVDGGAFVFTAFIMNDEARRLIAEGKASHTMTFRLNDHCWHDREDPLYCIGYEESWLRQQCEALGYSVDRMIPGHWCGRERAWNPDYQDYVVVRRKQVAAEPSTSAP
jgi:SAM-dependent methyltransferase